MSIENPSYELLPSSLPAEHEGSVENMRITQAELQELRRQQGDIALFETDIERPTNEPNVPEGKREYDELFDPNYNGPDSNEGAFIRPKQEDMQTLARRARDRSFLANQEYERKKSGMSN